MKQLVLNIPDFVDLDEKKIFMMLASRLYGEGKLSQGQAAELIGVSKRTFTELLGDYQESVFNYPITDLSQDVKNA